MVSTRSRCSTNPAATGPRMCPITIKHADGTANVTWNMQQGSTFGFAVAVGTYRFVAAQTNTVTLSTAGVNGKVIADSVGFVKIENNVAPVATNVQVAGSAAVGGTLTGSYDYSDAEQRPRGRQPVPVVSQRRCRLRCGGCRDFRCHRPELRCPARRHRQVPLLRGDAGRLDGDSPAARRCRAPPRRRSPPTTRRSPPGFRFPGRRCWAPSSPVPTPTAMRTATPRGRASSAGIAATTRCSTRATRSWPVRSRWCRARSRPRPRSTRSGSPSNLFNPNGMSASGEVLFNLDGIQPGEPTSADGVSWVTPSGSESSLLAGRKAWFVADLGARYALDAVADLEFPVGPQHRRPEQPRDLAVRSLPARQRGRHRRRHRRRRRDQWGAFGGDLQPRQCQSLAGRPASTSRSHGHPMPTATPGRAIRSPARPGASSPSSPTAITAATASPWARSGCGSGQSSIQYTPVAEDAGKYLIFEVTPVAADGNPLGAPVQSPAIGPVGQGNAPPVASAVTVSGVAREGETLTGQYAYSDAEGDPEGASLYQWFLSQDSVS